MEPIKIYAIIGTTPTGKRRIIGQWARRCFAETKIEELLCEGTARVKAKIVELKPQESLSLVVLKEDPLEEEVHGTCKLEG